MLTNGSGLIIGADGQQRCWWPGEDAQYVAYHDAEWGVPVSDDIRLFEKVSLEGFQAGLSWLTILRKLENFRRGFDGFDFTKVAGYGEVEIDRLMRDAGIVRHRGKIESVINNAARAMDLAREFGSLAAYFWQFEPDTTGWSYDYGARRATCPEAHALSKDLKKRGWKFVGPTTMYALMQAMGMVNDHLDGCCCRPVVEEKRAVFIRPKP